MNNVGSGRFNQMNGSSDEGETSLGPWSVVQKQRKGKKVVVGRKIESLGSINGGQVVMGSWFAMLSEKSLEINDKIN